MGIEGIPPGANSGNVEKSKIESKARVEKPITPKTSGKPPAASKQTPVTGSGQQKSQVENQAQPNGHSVVELEALSQQMRQMEAMHRTRSEVSEINQSLYQTQEDLESATQERVQAFQGAARLDGSAWEKMDVTEKAQRINRLKDKIKSLELERGELVQNLREQVLNGTYKVSGKEILHGMLEEYF